MSKLSNNSSNTIHILIHYKGQARPHNCPRGSGWPSCQIDSSPPLIALIENLERKKQVAQLYGEQLTGANPLSG